MDEEVALTGDFTLGKGSMLAHGSLLTEDIVVSGDQAISSEMILQPGSILKAGSSLGVNISPDTAAGTTLGDTRMKRLSDLNVLTREDANSSIAVAQAALKDLGKIRGGAWDRSRISSPATWPPSAPQRLMRALRSPPSGISILPKRRRISLNCRS